MAEKDLTKDEEGNFMTEAGEKVEMIQEENFVFHLN